MPQLINLRGERFGFLIVLECLGRNTKRRYSWLCLCDCGAKTKVLGSDLRSGHTRSCGCQHGALITQNKLRHGKRKANAPIYTVWINMRQRCGNSENHSYKDYGGRGIKVCDRWDSSFENFLQDAGGPPGPEYTIDRIDNNGNYEPGNIRWATRKEQANNRRPRSTST